MCGWAIYVNMHRICWTLVGSDLVHVNWEIFVVKMFSDSMASPKIKHAMTICMINDSAVQGRLSENYLTRQFITRNICDAKYSRFTVCLLIRVCVHEGNGGETLNFFTGFFSRGRVDPTPSCIGTVPAITTHCTRSTSTGCTHLSHTHHCPTTLHCTTKSGEFWPIIKSLAIDSCMQQLP